MFNDYGANWSLTDLYPDCESTVRSLVNKGTAFREFDIECRKEPQSWTISCDGEMFHVNVWIGMDDLPSLIDDASYLNEDLTDDEHYDILTTLERLNVYPEEGESFTLPVSASFEQIIDRVNLAAQILDLKQQNIFSMVEGMVAYVIEHRREKE